MLFTLEASSQAAESLPIATERPSVGTAPDVVPSDSLQMESGANVSYSKTDYVADLPEVLTRLGIGHKMELRLTSSNAVYQMAADPGTKHLQFQDMGFGMKVGLTGPNHRMAQSVVLNLSCPTGGPSQSSDTYDPMAILIWQQTLPKGYILTENVELLRTTVDGARRTNWLPNVAVGRAISKRYQWYAEYAPTFAKDASTLHVVDGGLLFSPFRTAQIDVRVGYQNDEAGRHNLISLGYSHRLDGLHLGNLFGRGSASVE